MCLEPLSQNNFCLLARFEARTNTQTCDHPERRRRCQRHRRESRYDTVAVTENADRRHHRN